MFGWIRERLSRKASAAGVAISVSRVGQPIWSERDYRAFADEAYVRNAVAFRCIKLISRSAAAIPWLLDDGRGNEIEKHAILKLLTHPAPMIGGNSLFEAVYAYLLIAGNSYLEAVGPDGKPPRELWALRPDRVKVVAGPYGMPQGFEYEANGRTIRWEADPLSGQSPILHLKEFHPLSDWYGLSPVEPASYSVDRHNAAVAHNTALIQNGSNPSGALVFKPITQTGGGVTHPPKEVIEAAEQRLLERHSGPSNAGRPLVMSGDVDWKQMGLSPRDMDFNESKLDAARDICLAFGVPHILIVPGASTYNNVREAKLELYEETILPLVDKLLDSLNAWLVPAFGENLNLSVDKDEVPALSLRRELKQKATIELYDKKLLTRDEARAALQYDQIGEADAAALDAAEKAETGLKKAQTVKALADTGLIGDEALGEAVTNMLVADGSLPGLSEAVEKFRPADFGDEVDEEGGGSQSGAGPFDGKAFDPAQPRGPDGRWITVGAAIAAAMQRSSKPVRADLGVVHQSELISSLISFDVSAFRHSLSSQGVAHTLRHHGPGTREVLRGQIAVTLSDFSKLRGILKAPAVIRRSTQSGKHGEPRIEVEKTICGVRFTYIAEVQRGKRRIEAVTMWKR